MPRGFGFSGSDEQLEKIQDWLKYFDKNTISYFSKGGGGADIGPLHRQTGTPMFGLSIDGQKYFEMHHTAKDVFELVHARELELGTASLASLIYLIDKYGLLEIVFLFGFFILLFLFFSLLFTRCLC